MSSPSYSVSKNDKDESFIDKLKKHWHIIVGIILLIIIAYFVINYYQKRKGGSDFKVTGQ